MGELKEKTNRYKNQEKRQRIIKIELKFSNTYYLMRKTKATG